MNFLKAIFAASNVKAVLTAAITGVVYLLAVFGVHLNANDANMILALGLFAASFFVQDASVGNWTTTATGAIAAVFYFFTRFGLNLDPSVQTTVLGLFGLVVGWLRVPGSYNPGPEPTPKGLT